MGGPRISRSDHPLPEGAALNPASTLGACTPAEWPALLGQLDEEFILARGRSGSLASRFPAAVGADFVGNVIVARQHGLPVSCCLLREFDWCSRGSIWRGAMIGMVYTAPAARGQGLAAQVLEEALRVLKSRNVDFAVLWSGLPRYYENLGWVRHDRGVFGVLELATPGEAVAAHAVDGMAVEAWRRSQQDGYLPRNALAWQANPLPAARTTCLAPSGREDACIVLGELGEHRYVHEVIGPAETFPALWRLACANATRVHVNETLGSPFHQWLAQHTGMRFTGQSLAHWRVLSHRARRAPWRCWSLPWFDRI